MAKTFIGIPSVYPQLLELRKSKTASFKPNRFLKETTQLRYYQVVGALHMMLLERMVLGDSTGLGKCVSEDTYINTTYGLIKIKSLIKDFMVEDNFYPLPGYINLLSINEVKKPSALYISGRKNGLTVKTNKGYEISGLPHHPILVSNSTGEEYKRIDQLKIGDYVCINRNGLFSSFFCKIESENIEFNSSVNTKTSYAKSTPQYLNEDLAELLGYFVSEGNAPRLSTMIITQFDPEIHERIRDLLKECFSYEENVNKSFKTSIKINSVFIGKVFESIGVDVLATSGYKTVPWSVLQSPKNIVRSFLRGYFEGDGGVEKKSGAVSCSSKSEEMIKQVQLILLNFGIISKRRCKMVKVNKRRKPYWILYFFGKDVDIFRKEIGFVSSRKTKELDNACKRKRNTNQDIIPFGSFLLKNSMRNIIEYLRTVPNQKNFSIRGSGWKGLVGSNYKRGIESVIYKSRKLSYERLVSFIDKIESLGLSDNIDNFKELKNTRNRNFFYDRVESISPCKKMFVDFHVPETHNFTGNGFVNHNTVQAISAYSWILEKEPDMKLLIVTPKSALYQWQEEFDKFTNGVSVRVITNSYENLTGYKARKLQYGRFKENVMIVGYATLRAEHDSIKDSLGKNYMVVFDEITAAKNRKTETHFACTQITESASRAYGLSATIIKNGLEEVYGIYAVIVPGLFGNITNFKKKFCQEKLIDLWINGKKRKIPKVVGYKNLQEFKQVIDPYFLIRKKQDVASELPKLISKKILLEMGPEQKEIYRKALTGIIYEERVKQEFFEITDKIRNGANDEKTMARYEVLKDKYEKFMTAEGKKRGKLAALTYCQMISNGPGLVRESGESSKEEEFVRLMTEELSTEKVILFTRFKSGISFLEVACEKNKIVYTKITGDENDRERRDARLKFQGSPDCNLIFITTAGSESLNLQAAGVVIFYDTPWSYGDLVQTIGRAQRIGSLQEHILLIHLVNKGSIDVRIMNRVSGKKDLSDEVLGDTAEGALDFTKSEEGAVDDLYGNLLEDAKDLQ